MAVPPPRHILLMAGLTLAGGCGAAVAIAYVTMAPPLDELALLGAYLLASGIASMAAGMLALRAAEASRRLSLQSRIFLISFAGSLTGIASIFVVARLMFVSTSHDLAVLAAVLAFVAFVSTAFGAFVASSLSSRVGLISAAIRGLGAGDYTSRLPDNAGDEIGRLAADVGALAGRLRLAEEERAAVERERRELTVAISHDLRTPLASLRAMVEALADEVVSGEEEARRYYGVMSREIERLGTLIDDLFELARIDSGALELEMSPLPLEEIAADVVAGMEAQARGLAIDLRLEAATGLPRALVDGRRIERAIANLLRNALQHTPRGGKVEVSLRQEHSWIVLSVSDSGTGIDAALLPRVWERFYRAEASRTRDAGVSDGAGLGLAIVRGFVEAHGGRVEAASHPLQGSTFTIRLPVPIS